MSAIRLKTIALGAVLWCAPTLFAQQYIISTVAGGGPPPTSVKAASVRLPVSGAIVTGLAGEVYFTSENAVVKVDASGVLTRVAGTGKYGYSGDGGPALDAQLAWPAGLALDRAGNLFIGDNANHRVRKVSPAGIISTIAGSGSGGYAGDDGPATDAQLNWPTGLAADASGNLYIADTANGRIRRVSLDSGVITTVSAGLHVAQGLAIDASGNLYIADYSVLSDDEGDNVYDGRILRMTASGATDTITPEGSGQGLLSPRGIAVDPAGNVYVADAAVGKVIKISPGGVITTAAGDVNGETDCPAIYFNLNRTQLVCPAGVALDSSGNLYVTDTGHGRIAKISQQGEIANLVGDVTPGNYWGDGGKASDAALDVPLGVAVDTVGNLYIADTRNSRVRKVSRDGVIITVAGNGTSGYSGDGGPATSAQLRSPAGLAVDASGNLYIADSLDNRIRKVSTDGTITTVAGRGDFNPPLGDGGPATSAALAGPLGVAVDTGGNLYIADTSFFVIRKVSAAGIITTIAGHNFYDPGGASEVGFPTGVAVDAAGNLYIATLFSILKRSPDGTISTVAGKQANGIDSSSGDGGPATSATLQGPFSVAVDASGNLYISGGYLSGYPAGAAHVRIVTPDGMINTIAGNGITGYSGDGGPATSASFSAAAAGITVDAGGTVYVADIYNNVIRALRPSPQ
jgi:sugar lactone lactonase YvrE